MSMSVDNWEDSTDDHKTRWEGTRSQHHYMLLNELRPQDSYLNCCIALRLEKANADRLTKSIHLMLESTGAIKVAFDRQGTHLIAFTSENVEPLVSAHAFSGDEAMQQINDIAKAPFDLSVSGFRAAIVAEPSAIHLVLCAHRAVCDYNSLEDLAREIGTHYQNLEASAQVPPCKVATLRQETDHNRAESLAHFSETINAPDGLLDLRCAKTRPSQQSFSGAEFQKKLNTQLASGVAELAQLMGVDRQIIWLTAWACLLNRYSSQSTLCVGVSFPGCRTRNKKILIGPLEECLPVNIDLDPQDSFADSIRTVLAGYSQTAQLENVSFGTLLDFVSPRRSASYHPLFQAGFNYRNSALPYFEDNVQVGIEHIHNSGSLLDLSLCVQEYSSPAQNAEQTSLHIEYATELFDSDVIERMLEHLLTIVESAVAAPSTKISGVRILPDAEYQQLIHAWNATENLPVENLSLHELFAAQAAKTPNRTAVVHGDNSLTYSELDASANRLANFLRDSGVGPDVLVGVCVERSVAMLVSLLGIMKAGGGYVPIDPNYPNDRIQYMAEHSKAPWMITDCDLRERLPNSTASILRIDECQSELSQYPDTAPPAIGTPQNLAYVIYTSGSTGKPKGVQVPQIAAANFITSMAKQPGITEDDVVVAVTTLSFDIAVLELFLPISAGARTVIADREVAADGMRLLSLLKNSRATMLQATPSTWQMLVSAGLDDNDLVALCGGEAMPEKLAQELVCRVKHLWNMYGPTETTVWSTCTRIDDANAPILIGRPIDNTRLYILDQYLQPVPIGIPGELYIGGLGVTRGYLHRDDLTNDRFVNDHFSTGSGAKLYRTGDSVRYRPDGHLEYLNRLDNQVKVRGFRIELGEIESCIARYSYISQNVVVVREDHPGDKRLVCYFIAEAGDVPERELRQHVSSSLPSYMVPQHFVELKELPQTPNGKVDRKALPPPNALREKDTTYEIPADLQRLPQADWIFEPDYSLSPLSRDIVPAEIGKWLVLMDEVGIADKIVTELETREHEVIRVRSADQYRKISDTEYCINPEYGQQHFAQLTRDLDISGQLPNRVLHAFLLTGEERFRPGSSLFHRNQEHGFQSILHLTRELRRRPNLGNLHTTVVMNGAQSLKGENLPYPEKATAIGAITALGATAPGQSASAVDIDFPPTAAKPFLSPGFLNYRKRVRQTADLILTEILAPANNQVVAYRESQRYVLGYVRRPKQSRSSTSVITSRVCLITNGLSAPGLALASRLSSVQGSHIVLVDNHALTDPRIWPDVARGNSPLAQTAGQLISLRESGASITVAEADVADAEAMRRVFESTKNATGHHIEAVYHLTMGSPDRSNTSTCVDSVESELDARIHGTRVLHFLAAERDTPLYLLSGLAHVIPDDDDVSSSAGAAYMQALAIQSTCSDGPRTTLIAGAEPAADSSHALPRTRIPETRSPIDMLKEHAYLNRPGVDEFLNSFEQSVQMTTNPVHLIWSIDIAAYRDEILRVRSRETRSQWVAPRDDIESMLLKVWKRILGISELSVTDNFFEIGGHSLTAVQLFNEIQSNYNVEWPLAVLFESPTIESCANRIREALAGDSTNTGAEMRHVVELHPGPRDSDRTPMFIVAGAFGNVLNLRHFAQLLGSDRPVYGIQARGLSGKDKPHESFQEMASAYLNEIREIQQSGPYLLGGFCSGGTAAFEMSRQLEKSGETVSHLVLLDTTSPGWKEPELTISEKIKMHTERLRREGLTYPLKWLRTRYLWEKQQLHRLIGDSEAESSSALFRSAAIFNATERAENKYYPGNYTGRAILLRPRLDRCHVFGPERAINKHRAFVREDNGWSSNLPQLVIKEVAAEPGDHDGFVLEPAVRNLVQQLREFIND